MPGCHVTDHQMRLYMTLRQSDVPAVALAKASINSPRPIASNMSLDKKEIVGARIRSRIFFDVEVIPMLKAAPRLRAVAIFEEMQRRTLERCTRVDGDGQTLDGGKYNYTQRFLSGGLPPMNAFWSFTMYDRKTQLLIQNPINRCLVNSPMIPAMKTNAEGSLTLRIQNKSPGTDEEANCLPAPDGPIYLVMRLYWRMTRPPSILPAGEGTWLSIGVEYWL